MEKTAMQQLKEKLEKTLEKMRQDAIVKPIKPQADGYYSAINSVIKDIDSQMMAIENEQLSKAFYKIDLNLTFEQYYSQTFEK